MNYLTRFCLGLCYLCIHKLLHVFLHWFNPIFSSRLVIELPHHYLLNFPNFLNEKTTLLDTSSSVNLDILNEKLVTIILIILYCNPTYSPRCISFSVFDDYIDFDLVLCALIDKK